MLVLPLLSPLCSKLLIIAEINNVYANLTLLEEAGFPAPDWDWVWNDLLEMTRRVTRDQDGDGEAETIGATIRQYEQEIGPFIYSNGGSYMDRQAAGTEVTFDSPGTIAALEFVRSLIHDYGVAMPRQDRERWVSGRLAFNFTGSWNLGAYRDLVGDNFVWDYIPYPRNPTTGGRASRLSVIGISVAAGTEHLEEAVRFALLTAQPTAQRGFLRAGLSPVPVRLDLFDTPEMQAIAAISPSAARTIQETLSQGEAVAETVYPDMRMQTIAVEAIAAILIDGADPQIIVREAARQMREVLAEVLGR